MTRADAVETDLAAAEAALSLIRGQGQRRGFTGDHLELAGQLKQVLDESPVWDTITPDTEVQEDRAQTTPLEPALQPERVWSAEDWDDMIVLDAAFAGTVITVLRPPGQVGPSSYVFVSDTPSRRGAKEVADTNKIGMIAAGDRTPDPGRAAEYDSLGQQVRHHLIGLVDAVAESRESRLDQETRRLHATQASFGSPVEAAYQRPQPTRGTGGDPNRPSTRPFSASSPAHHRSPWWCAGTTSTPPATPTSCPNSPTGSAGCAPPTGSRPPSSHPAGSPTPGIREDVGHLWTGWLLTRHPDAGVRMIGLDWDQRRDAAINRLREATAITGCTAARHQAEPEPQPAMPVSAERLWQNHLDSQTRQRVRAIARQAAIEQAVEILQAAELRHGPGAGRPRRYRRRPRQRQRRRPHPGRPTPAPARRGRR